MTKSSLLTALSSRDDAYAALLRADVEIAKRSGVVPDAWRERRRVLYQVWRRSVGEYKRQFSLARKELS